MELDKGGLATHWDKLPETAKYAIAQIRKDKERTAYIVIESNVVNSLSVTFNIDGLEADISFDYSEYPEMIELKEKCIQIALDKMDQVNSRNRLFLKRIQCDVPKALLPDNIRDEL